MKKNSNDHGERVVNYLATCGKLRVETLDIMSALFPGIEDKDEFDQALHRVSQVLQGLASGGMVKLSKESIPSRHYVPKEVEITLKMRDARDKVLDSGGPRKEPGEEDAARPGSAKRGKDSAKDEDEVTRRFHAFVELFEKKRKLAEVPGEWGRVTAVLIYDLMEEETPFKACVKSFVMGGAWQTYPGRVDCGKGATQEKEKAEPELRPELVAQLGEIVRASEEKKGELKPGRKMRRPSREADAPMARLRRKEIAEFVHWIHGMNDDAGPGRRWREALSLFFNELTENLPLYQACREAFTAGIVFQLNRQRLERMD